MSSLHAGANETVTVKYYVEYPSEDKYLCGVSQEPIPNPVQVVIPADSAAFEAIRNAVDQYGSSYNFTATYYQNTGYVIDAINNVPYTITHQPPSMCFWKFIVQYPTGSEIPPYEGVSKYTFDSDGFGVIMRYENACPHPNNESKKQKEEL